MKKIFSYLLLLSLSLLCVAILQAQNRPRRVGSGAQSPTTVTPSTPTRAPVLGGANRPVGSQTNRGAATAGNEPEEVEAGDVIKVDTTLVTLPVSVMNRDGRYVPNLRKEDFRLWEDGVEQTVAFFASVDKPFSLVLMIDTSGSTRFRLEDIQDAAIAFVNQLRPDDRVMVLAFDDDIRVLSEFTSDRYRLRDAIRRTRTGNGTRLYDAVDMVMNQRFSHIEGRKAIVLFSDGVDTTSRHASYQSNIRDAEELDALVYPVQYDTYSDVNGGGGTQWPGTGGGGSNGTVVDILGQILGGVARSKNSRRGGGGVITGGGNSGGVGASRREYELANHYLHELAERTGARHQQADSIQNISVAFATIAEELRRQYSLGYYPKTQAQAGQRRQIRVRVNQPNLAVRTRDSYIFNPTGSAPQDAAAQRSTPVLQKKFSASDGYSTRNQVNRD